MFSFKILRNWCVWGEEQSVFSLFWTRSWISAAYFSWMLHAHGALCTRPQLFWQHCFRCVDNRLPPPLPGAEVKRCPGGKMGKPRANISSPAKRCTDSVNIVLFTLPFTSLPLFDNGCSRGKATSAVSGHLLYDYGDRTPLGQRLTLAT